LPGAGGTAYGELAGDGEAAMGKTGVAVMAFVLGASARPFRRENACLALPGEEHR